MGKIRVKTLGNEEEEKKQKEEAKKRREAKKMAKGDRGGEKVVSMSPTEEELAKEEIKETEEPKETKVQKKKKFDKQEAKKLAHSKRYQDASIKIDPTKIYPLSSAIGMLKQISNTKFDSTVELHINTIDKGISGQVSLPHGTGKSIRVVIADPAKTAEFDAMLKKIEAGTISFDVLIATPAAMPRLAKVAKILGPRGLMPNPKNGTISDAPERLALSFAKGQINFKTESQAPIIHAAVGKASFPEKNLEENITTFLNTVGKGKIRNVTVKSTMSPGIKVDFASI